MKKIAMFAILGTCIIAGIAVALGYLTLYKTGGMRVIKYPVCSGIDIPAGPDDRAVDGMATFLCIGKFEYVPNPNMPQTEAN